uniref:Serpentine receptor class gamma n=1 Tax=Panagrellus redivivus TaxID=6233 RepID=A0A7E4W717_PANRE
MVPMISDIVTTCLILPLWMFQISVMICLIYFRSKRHEMFTSTFFLLIIMLEVMNSLNELTLFLIRRVTFLDFLKDFYLHATLYSSTVYITSAYALYTLCFLRVAIAINRLYGVQTLLAHRSVTLQKYGKTAIIFIPLLAFPFLILRFFHPATFFLHTDGNLHLIYPNPDIQKYQSAVATLVLLITSILAFVITVVTILKYRTLSKHSNLSASKVKKIRHDYRLLWQSILVLCIQVLLCVFQVSLFIATRTGNNDLLAFSKVLFGYFDDAFSLVNSVTLIVMNGSLFIGYLDPDIQKYQSFVSAIVLVTTTLLAFFISMITILKYRALSRKTDLSAFKVKKMRYEHRLLWQSMLVLFIQILLCSTQVPLYVATRIHSNDLLAVSKVIYSYCDDAFGLVNSITLIVISRNTRQNYVTFWKGIWSNKIQMASTTRIETMRSVSKIQAT